jgi:hypothetical protein
MLPNSSLLRNLSQQRFRNPSQNEQTASSRLRPWIKKRPIFVKTEETGPVWFHRFLINRPTEFENLKIKNSKKLEAICRFLVETEFKKLK